MSMCDINLKPTVDVNLMSTVDVTKRLSFLTFGWLSVDIKCWHQFDVNSKCFAHWENLSKNRPHTHTASVSIKLARSMQRESNKKMKDTYDVINLYWHFLNDQLLQWLPLRHVPSWPFQDFEMVISRQTVSMSSDGTDLMGQIIQCQLNQASPSNYIEFIE